MMKNWIVVYISIYVAYNKKKDFANVYLLTNSTQSPRTISQQILSARNITISHQEVSSMALILMLNSKPSYPHVLNGKSTRASLQYTPVTSPQVICMASYIE